jgi:hypothetical protein
MRNLKLVLGILCLVAALLPGGLALLGCAYLRGPGKLHTFYVVSIMAALAISLASVGWFLIVQRALAMSWKARGLTILAFLCIGIFVVVVIPNFIKARSTTAANACVNNLRQIDAAANEFALEKNLKAGEKINFPNNLTPYIKLNSQGKIPPCPQGGIYSIKKVGDTPTCSLGTNDNWAHVLP